MADGNSDDKKPGIELMIDHLQVRTKVGKNPNKKTPTEAGV